jgi:hypothetical protein
MVICYQNASGIELLDDYCFVIHHQASPGELFLCDYILKLISLTALDRIVCEPSKNA